MPKKEDQSDACPFPQPDTVLSSIETLSLTPEATLLKLLKRLSSKFIVPEFKEEDLRESIQPTLEGIAYYLSTCWENVPELYFKRPEKSPLACIAKPTFIEGGSVRDFVFKSKFVSVSPEYEKRRKLQPQNDSVKIRYWKHEDKESSGTVIAVHGWMLGDDKAKALTMVPGYFFSLGLDVLLYELPYHGGRSPSDVHPLKMFPSIDPVITNESFAQAIFELRALRDWLDEIDKKPVVAVGLSLGAQTVALWSSLDRLDGVICIAPVVSIAKRIWHYVKCSPLADTLIKVGLTEDFFDRAFASGSPLSYFLTTEKQRVLIIASKEDHIVPFEEVQTLVDHWKQPKTHFVPKGHVEQLVNDETLLVVKNFLNSLGLIKESNHK